MTLIYPSQAHGEGGAKGGGGKAPVANPSLCPGKDDSGSLSKTRVSIVERFSLPVVHIGHHLHLQLRSQLLGSKRIHVSLARWRTATRSSVLGADMIVSTDPTRFTLASGGCRFQTSKDHCPQQTEVEARPCQRTVPSSRSPRMSSAEPRVGNRDLSAP